MCDLRYRSQPLCTLSPQASGVTDVQAWKEGGAQSVLRPAQGHRDKTKGQAWPTRLFSVVDLSQLVTTSCER